MNQSTDKPINLSGFARLLRDLRRKHRISLNQLARATGLSRRTLGRLEAAGSKSESRNFGRKAKRGKAEKQILRCAQDDRKGRGISGRTAYKLARFLLGPEATERALEDATRLSRFLGDDPLYKYLDVLYHYPAFLFHDSPEQRALRAEFGDDYRHSLDLLLRSGFGTRNLGARLRAFRMQHDLTLIETAALLDLSKSELHRLERAERNPSPRTRYRVLRLLTSPLPESVETRKACLRRQAQLDKRPGGISVHPCLPRAESRGASVVPLLKAALAARPPAPGEAGDADALARLRHVWLAGPLKTKELAAALGVSQPHLIRLLRGDRNPSRRLREQLARVLG
jgi:transcriptional regulator with XRE-family HTH domain